VVDAKLTSPEAALALIEQTVNQVRKGELDVRVGNSIAYLAGSAVKVWEVMLSDKIRKLEKILMRSRGLRR
jgi:hypothetical protein